MPWLEGWELVMTTGMRAGRPGTPACLHRAYGGSPDRRPRDLAGPARTADQRSTPGGRRPHPVPGGRGLDRGAVRRAVTDDRRREHRRRAQHRLVTHLGIFDTLRASTAEGPPSPSSCAAWNSCRAIGCSCARPASSSSTASPRHRRRSLSTIFLGGAASPGHPGRLHRHDPARPSHGRPARRARPRRCGPRRADGGPAHRDGRRARARQPRARAQVIRREEPRRWRSC